MANYTAINQLNTTMYIIYQTISADVIAMSETQLSSNSSSSASFPDGYYVFRKDRTDGYGGVLLAWHVEAV